MTKRSSDSTPPPCPLAADASTKPGPIPLLPCKEVCPAPNGDHGAGRSDPSAAGLAKKRATSPNPRGWR